MTKSPKLLVLAIVVAATTALVAVVVTGGANAGAARTVSYLVRNNGIEYVTATGSSNTFPGRLVTGDRIFARDSRLRAGVQIGYDNELCTVTFDGNDLCHVAPVFKGRGSIQITWLWVGRNLSQSGPPRFAGVIEGGTGAYANAAGQFTASMLSTGELEINARIS
jgi:hypothetical protein